MFNIKIMSVPERINMSQELCKMLNLSIDNICVDVFHNGPLFNQIQCLQNMVQSNVSHVIILQDDALPCDNFQEICDNIIQSHPNDVIGLFPYDFLDDEVQIDKNSVSPYYDVGKLSGVGVIIPTIYVEHYLKYLKQNGDKFNRQDDLALYSFCKENNIQMLQTVPAVVQHIGDQSIFDKKNSIRRSKYFYQDNNIDWLSKEINHLKYHSALERMISEKVEKSKEYIKRICEEDRKNEKV